MATSDDMLKPRPCVSNTMTWCSRKPGSSMPTPTIGSSGRSRPGRCWTNRKTAAPRVPEDAAEGKRCLVELDRLGPMRGEVRWMKVIDDEVCKIGIHDLEPR